MKVSIVGSGNVGTHLLRALGATAEVSAANPRTLSGLDADADVVLIAVSDSAIGEVAAKLSSLDAIVAHTSGSTPIDILRQAGAKRPGVFYPLQTFSRETSLDYSRIPVFIEAENTSDAATLRELALGMTAAVYPADSQSRRRLHLASVLACNFVNHLWALADSELAKSGLSIDVLRPLIEETAAKLERLSPYEGQTGPARRGDTPTIDAHLEMLADNPQLQNIYRLLSDSITDTYTRK